MTLILTLYPNQAHEYCPAVGLRLLAPFSAQETNRAYYMLQVSQ